MKMNNVQRSMGGPGSDKRFCTVQVAVAASAEVTATLPISVIFRGAGKVLTAEQGGYDPRVHVGFQLKAWADSVYCESWLTTVLGPWLETHCPGQAFLLFCDSLKGQRRRSVIDRLHAMRGAACFGPPNKTDCWQPIDRGHIGAVLKMKIRALQEEWLMQLDATNKPNWERWERGLTAREKRTLVTWWVGEAWAELVGKHPDLIESAWKYTGCNMVIPDQECQAKVIGSPVEIDPSVFLKPFDDIKYLSWAWSKCPTFEYSDKAAALVAEISSSESDSDSSSSSSDVLVDSESDSYGLDP